MMKFENGLVGVALLINTTLVFSNSVLVIILAFQLSGLLSRGVLGSSRGFLVTIQ